MKITIEKSECDGPQAPSEPVVIEEVAELVLVCNRFIEVRHDDGRTERFQDPSLIVRFGEPRAGFRLCGQLEEAKMQFPMLIQQAAQRANANKIKIPQAHIKFQPAGPNNGRR